MPKQEMTMADVLSKKSLHKARVETAKTVAIAVLVTAVIAFICGMHFSNNQHAQVEQAVKAAGVPQVPAKK